MANINKWVKETTEGKIEDFLSEMADDTVLLLLNVIHFQGALLLIAGPPLWRLLPPPCRLSRLCSRSLFLLRVEPLGGSLGESRRQGVVWQGGGPGTGWGCCGEGTLEGNPV